MEKCCRNKKTPRDEELIKNIKMRLNKISGQVNGISKMIDDNRYCGDVLTQISAIESALREVGYIILKDHLYTCVSEDIKNGYYDSLEETIEITKKLK